MFKEKATRILDGKSRFILPLLIIIILKILGSFFIYQRLSVLGNFYTPWMDEWGKLGPTQPWLYLFSAEDTGFYVAIAKSWYAYPMYVFFPAYPVLSMALSILTGDPWLSAFIVSFILGLASMPLFQALAEQYMSKSEATASALLTFTFPYVFLFTTVSYTESLFLFSTVACWYLYIKGKIISSVFAATLATLTKNYGVAIIIPVAVGLLAKKKFKQIPFLAIPIAFLLSWIYYLYLSTGDPFAFSTQQSYWKGRGVGFGWYEFYIKPFLDFNVWKPQDFYYLLVALVIFFSYLVFCVFRTDVKLGIYSLSVFLPLLYLGSFISLPRFFSFIFPIWLVVRNKNPVIVVVAVAFFIFNSLLIWYQFIVAWVA